MSTTSPTVRPAIPLTEDEKRQHRAAKLANALELSDGVGHVSITRDGTAVIVLTAEEVTDQINLHRERQLNAL